MIFCRRGCDVFLGKPSIAHVLCVFGGISNRKRAFCTKVFYTNTHRGLFYFPKIITLHNTHSPHPSYHLATLTPTPPGWDLDELRRSSRIHNGNPSMAPNDILRRNRNSPHHHRRNTTHTRNDVHGPRRTRPLIPC